MTACAPGRIRTCDHRLRRANSRDLTSSWTTAYDRCHATVPCLPVRFSVGRGGGRARVAIPEMRAASAGARRSSSSAIACGSPDCPPSGVRFEALDVNATNRPSGLMAASRLKPLACVPLVETLTRVVWAARLGGVTSRRTMNATNHRSCMKDPKYHRTSLPGMRSVPGGCYRKSGTCQ